MCIFLYTSTKVDIVFYQIYVNFLYDFNIKNVKEIINNMKRKKLEDILSIFVVVILLFGFIGLVLRVCESSMDNKIKNITLQQIEQKISPKI
jgi:hypothetical protein